MNYKSSIIVILLLFVCCKCSLDKQLSLSSSVTQDNILSISTLFSTDNDETKEILLIDPWNNKLISNSTINIPYEILDILFVDFVENTAVILCENNTSNGFLLVSLQNINTQVTYSIDSSEIKSEFKEQDYSRNKLQKFIFNNKIGYIPIELIVNQTSYIMELNFPNNNINFIELLTPDICIIGNSDCYSDSNQLVQGFDYNNKIMYLSYKTNENNINILSYDPSNPSTTQKLYISIKNISTNVLMIFLDSNSDIYLIIGISNSSNIICKLDSTTSECNQVYAITTSAINKNYNFQPYFLNQDKSSLIVLSVVDIINLDVEIIEINDFSSTSMIIPSNQWSNSNGVIWTKYAF